MTAQKSFEPPSLVAFSYRHINRGRQNANSRQTSHQRSPQLPPNIITADERHLFQLTCKSFKVKPNKQTVTRQRDETVERLEDGTEDKNNSDNNLNSHRAGSSGSKVIYQHKDGVDVNTEIKSHGAASLGKLIVQ